MEKPLVKRGPVPHPKVAAHKYVRPHGCVMDSGTVDVNIAGFPVLDSAIGDGFLMLL